MFSLVAKAQGQTTELGKCLEAEGTWGAVPGQEHHLQVRSRIWGAADSPSATHSLAGWPGQGKGVLHCVQERAQRHPCVPRPCHQSACCSHLASLLLGVPSRSPAADRNQRLLQPPASASGNALASGLEPSPSHAGEQPPPRHPRDSPLDAGHHRCVTSLVQERGEAAGQGSSWGCRQVPSRPGVAGDTRGKGTAPSSALLIPSGLPAFSLIPFLLWPHLSPFPLLSVLPPLPSSFSSFIPHSPDFPSPASGPLEVGARIHYRTLHRPCIYFGERGLGSGCDPPPPQLHTISHTLSRAF